MSVYSAASAPGLATAVTGDSALISETLQTSPPLDRQAAGTSGLRPARKRAAPESRSRGCSSKASKTTQREESLYQSALDREFEKAQREAAKRALDQRSMEQVSPCPFKKLPITSDSP